MKCTKEQIQKIVKNSLTIKEAAQKLKITRISFKKYCLEYQIDLSHFDPYYFKRPPKKEQRRCLQCNTLFICSPYEKKKFCSRRCSNLNRSPRTEQSKQKTSNTIKTRIQKEGKWGAMAHKHILNYTKNKQICPICNKEFEVHKYNKTRIYCSKKCYNNDIGKQFVKYSSGGYRKGSGRGKSGYYKGFWCDSTYELAYLIYCLDHKIDIQRNKQGYKYSWHGKQLTYYPDFIVEGNLVEIKGYDTSQVRAKLNAVNQNIEVLFKEDLVDIFNYVAKTYNKKWNFSNNNFYELYDPL